MKDQPVLFAVEAVRLAQDEAAGGWMTFAFIGLAALSVVMMGGLISWWAWRDRTRDSLPDQAFRTLCRRGRVDSRAVAALRRLAQKSAIPPVALLLSEQARQRALASFGAEPGLDRLAESPETGR